MSAPVRARRVPFWLFWLALLLAPQVAWADSHIIADFDGDGRQDHAVVDHRSTAIHVWLSGSRRISTIPNPTRARQLAARDLDGDRRDELLVAGASTGLAVWTLESTGAFVEVRDQSPPGPGVSSEYRLEDAADDGQDGAEVAQASPFVAPRVHAVGDAQTSTRIVHPSPFPVRIRFSSTLGARPPPPSR